MIKIGLDETIHINQGDTGNIKFSLPGYILTNKDKLILVVKDNDNTILKTQCAIFQQGNGYFGISTNDTQNIAPGEYTYYIGFKLYEQDVFTFISNKKFNLKRGVVNEF